MGYRWQYWLMSMLVGVSLPAAPETLNDPYGIVSHIDGSEFDVAPRQYELLRGLDIRWVRTDCRWGEIEKEPGQWNFDRYDEVFQCAKQHGMTVLPILDYDVPWKRPAWKHLDAWSDYVRKAVTRYGKDTRCWEVWNEQNSQLFWRDKPSGENYTALLKRTYEEIKKIDPGLTVLYGGTAGVPLEYIEETFKAGAGDSFDVMNIHPYNLQATPEAMIRQIGDLKSLMKKYKLDKPVWITEVGWATAQMPRLLRDVLPLAFKRAGLDQSQLTVAIVYDPEKGFFGAQNFDAKACLPGVKEVEWITLDRLKGIGPEQYQVIIPAIDQDFPARYIPELVNYVKHGGTLLLPARLPFYWDLQLDGRGGYKRVQVGDRYMRDFHIGWETHWTKKGVPFMDAWQKPAPEFAGQFEIAFTQTGLFLNDGNLKEGDRFIPLIEAGTKDYKGVVAAIYQLNSDLKGNLIVFTTRTVPESVSEERQAEMLPRAFLIAFASGVERMFWYNLRSGEFRADDKEAHHGLIRKNFEFKPAFQALRTLVELCPNGSTVPVLTRKGDVCLVGWTRPDGVKVRAVWSSYRPEKIKLEIRGSGVEVCNHLGEKRPVPGPEYTVTESILYLIGAEFVAID